MSEFQRGLGCIPDTGDIRDQYYTITAPIQTLPPKVDLREQEAMKFEILDQGQLGSCTANAIAAAITYANYKQRMQKMNTVFVTNPFFMPSRLFIYYNERRIEGNISSDSGAMIRDGIKTVNKEGACKEITWPYKIDNFATKPGKQCYDEAKKYQTLLYQRVRNYDMNYIKAVLAEGFPVIFGFSVYESFMSMAVAKTGIVPMPSNKERLLGGHATLMCGYDDASKKVIVRNSWGKDWGDKGYCYMDYDYITNSDLVVDLWCVKLVEV